MKYWKILVTIAVLLTSALALYLPISSPTGILNTPDENANYFFAQKFSFSNGLRVFEPLADKVDNAIHPRGVNIIKDFLVPESFLGLPILYGTLLELTKWAWLPLVFASVLTIFAIFALYQLFLHFFERRTARLSILLVLTLPAFLYWLGRPYMHTILFLDFLILGWWMILWRSGLPVPPPSGGAPPLGGGTNRWYMVAGIFLGLALAMRTSEVVWVGVVTLLLLYSPSPGLRPARAGGPPSPLGRGEGEGAIARVWYVAHRRLLKLFFGAALIVISLLFINKDLYGNFFGTGYSVSETSLVVEGGQVPQLAHVSFIEQLLLPFGFHPVEAAGRFIKYAFGGIWWYVGPMLLGSLVMLSRRQKQETDRRIQQSIPNSQFPIPNEIPNSKFKNLGIRHFVRNWKLDIGNFSTRKNNQRQVDRTRGYVLTWCILSLYLVLAYGSFRAEVFADPLHPLSATIGAPYLRYWLPIFVFGAPFVAQFFIQLRSMISPSRRFYFLFSIFYFLMTFLSLRAVVWAGPESWQGIQENLGGFAEARQRAVRATPDNAVFVVPRWTDRVYFPARRVIVDVEGKDVVKIVRTLHDEQVPVFWHRGRGEIKLEQAFSPPARGGDEGVVGVSKFKLKRRFDIDPKGKVYEVKISN